MANYITVGQLNNYLKRKFEADVHLDHVYLKGEISNYKLHSRGHLYFSLKDETSVISAIMFSTSASSLNFEVKDGTKVFVEGKVTVYEASGKYQIIVTKMQPDGIGELYIAYEKLKKQLESEGLFKEEHKKPIPKYPHKIGIVTAPTGAAIRDILSTIKRRFPIAETILFPALVQGENAKFSVVENIKKAQEFDLDVLIVGRGGGSIEDLWAFNEEIVARSIFASRIPVISAVGHEVDFTIADFVADMRAPTPTGAAEMAVPNMSDVFKNIENYKIRMTENIRNKLKLLDKKLESIRSTYAFKNPLAIYEVKEQQLSSLIDKLYNIVDNTIKLNSAKLDKLRSSYVLKNPLAFYELDREKIKSFIKRLNSYIDSRVKLEQERFNKINEKTLYKNIDLTIKEKNNCYQLILNKLDLLNPLNILKNGYSVVLKNDKTIKTYKDININDNIDIKLGEGQIKAVVKEISNNEK